VSSALQSPPAADDAGAAPSTSASRSQPPRRSRRKVGLRKRARYAFDQTMARGTIALIGWLGLASLLLIFGAGLIIAATGADVGRSSFMGKIVFSFINAMDPSYIGWIEKPTWALMLGMFIVGISGLFIVSAFIGVMATALDERLEELRKGRSTVVEDDHTLILGWSETLFTIVSELSIANESRRKPAVVILADKDKVEMEDAIAQRVPDLRGTKLVCRTGSPIDLADLEIVNHQGARSIIVLAPEEGPGDSEVVKVLLALTGGPNRRPEPYHIVAEVQDPANLDIARLVTQDEAVVIDKRDTVAKLIVQTSRQSGAAAVYTELFDFGGHEMYFHEPNGLSGKTYADALNAYEEACVIGLQRADGSVTLNPSMDTRINGDRLLVIAEDDSVLENLSQVKVPIEEAVIVGTPRRPEPALQALILGWNDRGPTVVRELDAYASEGSELVLVSLKDDIEVPDVSNLRIDRRHDSTTDPLVLGALDIPHFTQIIVMADENLDIQHADAETLVTLLRLRQLLAAVPFDDRPAIVSEMLDDRNRQLAQVTEVDDVIVSDKILSLIMTQLSENADLEPVFADLLDAEGSEIYLRPVEEYVAIGGEVAFATIVEAARRRGETAIGFRSQAGAREAAGMYGIRVNPPKSEAFRPSLGDRVVVLAED
jgi:voltage-gated potassium channel Kch